LTSDGEMHGCIKAWMDREPSLWRLGQDKARWRDDETWGTIGLSEHKACLAGICLEEVVHQVGTDRPHPYEQCQA
jgi:hypothetical protein